jgi:hypothetical protein
MSVRSTYNIIFNDNLKTFAADGSRSKNAEILLTPNFLANMYVLSRFQGEKPLFICYIIVENKFHG